MQFNAVHVWMYVCTYVRMYVCMCVWGNYSIYTIYTCLSALTWPGQSGTVLTSSLAALVCECLWQASGILDHSHHVGPSSPQRTSNQGTLLAHSEHDTSARRLARFIQQLIGQVPPRFLHPLWLLESNGSDWFGFNSSLIRHQQHAQNIAVISDDAIRFSYMGGWGSKLGTPWG